MPLFEYVCKKCGHRFEALVYGSEQPACPMCRSLELEPVFSTFATSSSGRGGGASLAPGAGCGTGGGGG
jgi:putative FmdB family regulatory protein